MTLSSFTKRIVRQFDAAGACEDGLRWLRSINAASLTDLITKVRRGDRIEFASQLKWDRAARFLWWALRENKVKIVQPKPGRIQAWRRKYGLMRNTKATYVLLFHLQRSIVDCYRRNRSALYMRDWFLTHVKLLGDNIKINKPKAVTIVG